MVERRELGRGGEALRYVDEFAHGFGWVDDDDELRRTAHALAVDGRVWLVDAVDGDGVEERVRAAGEPAGVIQLLDRHARDCAALAARFGVPHHVVPAEPVGAFTFVPVMSWPKWREVALWWAGARVLICADALGTLGYFRARGETIGVHPLLRAAKPPKALAQLEPERVLVGHGDGVHENATAAVRETVRTARRRLLPTLVNAVREG